MIKEKQRDYACAAHYGPTEAKDQPPAKSFPIQNLQCLLEVFDKNIVSILGGDQWVPPKYIL